MNIVEIIPTLNLAGAETMCANLSVALKKKGCDVTVVVLNNQKTSLSEKLTSLGINVIFLGKKKLRNIDTIKRLRKILLSVKPDVIHTHLHADHYAFFASRGIGAVNVHTVHNIAEKEAQLPRRMLGRYCYKHGLVKPVALSSSIKESVERLYGIKDVPVVLNGIDFSKCIEKQSYFTDNVIKLIHVGRFSEQKNHVGLIKGFAKALKTVPNMKLTLVGDGPLFSSVSSLVDELGISDKVVFNGLSNNVYPLLNNADIFVLPSLYEGLPMSLLEAMGTGLCPVASDVGGISDVITSGKNGVLCKPDCDSFCKALLKVVLSSALIKDYGKAARLSVLEKYSAQAMACGYIKVFGYNKNQER